MIYLSLFTIFFRIGLFSYGGGLAMLPLIFQSVQDFGVMSAAQFSNLVALSQVTPGPIAVNGATYVGFHHGGILGSVVATLGVCLPSFVLVLLAMRFMDAFQNNRILQGVFLGIRPGAVGLIAAAAALIGETVLVKGSLFSEMLFRDPKAWLKPIPCVFFLVALLLAGKCKLHPIWVALLMGGAGALLYGQSVLS